MASAPLFKVFIDCRDLRGLFQNEWTGAVEERASARGMVEDLDDLVQDLRRDSVPWTSVVANGIRHSVKHSWKGLRSEASPC